MFQATYSSTLSVENNLVVWLSLLSGGKLRLLIILIYIP